MRIALCYVAVTHGPLTADYCARFVATFIEYPPGMEAEIFVCCNGGPLSYEKAVMFAPLKVKFLPRQNDPGWDISAYIEAARGPCKDFDLMLCLGESCYFHRAGWLARLVLAWNRFGPGMYGSFSSNLVRSHLNTTGFCCPPKVLASYPKPVTSRGERYEFEHGNQAFWRMVALRGMPVRLVTWDGIWEPRVWRCPKDILWRGNQSNCLMWCQHTDRYVNADARTRLRWAKGADQPFK